MSGYMKSLNATMAALMRALLTSARKTAGDKSHVDIVREKHEPNVFTGEFNHGLYIKLIKNDEGGVVSGVISSDVRYAGFHERGTRPHFVPAKYIRPWAIYHGIAGAEDLGWPGMRVRGTAFRPLRRSSGDIFENARNLFLKYFGR